MRDIHDIELRLRTLQMFKDISSDPVYLKEKAQAIMESPTGLYAVKLLHVINREHVLRNCIQKGTLRYLKQHNYIDDDYNIIKWL